MMNIFFEKVGLDQYTSWCKDGQMAIDETKDIVNQMLLNAK